MRSSVKAMIWECWRLSRGELLFRLPMLLLAASLVWLPGMDESRLTVLPLIVIAFLGINSLFSFSWLNGFDSVSGFAFRTGFTRPITTRCLVTTPFLFIVITSWLSYAIPAALIRWIQGLPIPVLTPATFVASTVGIMVMISWSIRSQPFRVVLLGMVSMLMFAVPIIVLTMLDMEQILNSLKTGTFLQFGWWFQCSGVFCIATAATLTTMGVDRQRHGDAFLLSSGLKTSRPVNEAKVCELKARFSSPFQAQMWFEMWFEWKAFGSNVLFAAIAVVICSFLLFAAIYLKLPQDMRVERIDFIAVFIVGFSPMLLQIIGCDGALGIRSRQGFARIPLYALTRPISTERSLLAKLVVILATSIAGWVIVVTAVISFVWIIGGFDVSEVSRIVKLTYPRIDRAILSLAVLWIVNGLLVTIAGLMIFGLLVPLHAKNSYVLVVAGLIVSSAIVADMANGWRFKALWNSLGVAIAILEAGVAIWFIQKSITQRCYGIPSLIVIAALWTANIAFLAQVYQRLDVDLQNQIPFQAIAMAALGLVSQLALVLSLPLAFDAHRCR
jgi:hypothetical protein